MKFSSLLCVAPDLLQGTTLPQFFGEIRSHVGWVRLHADQTNRTFWVMFTNAARCAISGQPATDDQILVLFHLVLLISYMSSRAVAGGVSLNRRQLEI